MINGSNNDVPDHVSIIPRLNCEPCQ